MHEAAGARPGSLFGKNLGRGGVELIKGLAPSLKQHADQIDARLRADQRPLDRVRHAHIGLNQLDLAHVADDPQFRDQVRVAHGDADAPAAACEGAHDIAADEPGTAEDGRQPLHQIASPRSGLGRAKGAMRDPDRG